MKTIKFLLLILLIQVYFNSCAKESEEIEEIRILETVEYRVAGICVEKTIFPELEIEFERSVFTRKIYETDFLLNFDNITYKGYDAFLSGDSLFIPLQWYPSYNGINASFQGKAKIENDSIFLSYKEGGPDGVFFCECKGKKISSTRNL